jgi:hypothetical protein
VQDCQVCGRRFDPLGFQVVVPELGRGFDRVECAQTAKALAPPGSRIATAPLVVVTEPIGGPASRAGPAAALRPLAAPAATLGLLAAGSAAAALLWLNALDTETAAFPLTRAPAPPAVGQETVQAHVQRAEGAPGEPLVRGPATRPEPESTETVLTAAQAPAGRPVGALTAAQAPAGRPVGAPTAPTSRPSGRPIATRPTTRTTVTARSAKAATGKDHPKRGLGHSKHGESDGVHTAGHGHHAGPSSHTRQSSPSRHGPHGHGKGH